MLSFNINSEIYNIPRYCELWKEQYLQGDSEFLARFRKFSKDIQDHVDSIRDPIIKERIPAIISSFEEIARDFEKAQKRAQESKLNFELDPSFVAFERREILRAKGRSALKGLEALADRIETIRVLQLLKRGKLEKAYCLLHKLKPLENPSALKYVSIYGLTASALENRMFSLFFATLEFSDIDRTKTLLQKCPKRQIDEYFLRRNHDEDISSLGKLAICTLKPAYCKAYYKALFNDFSNSDSLAELGCSGKKTVEVILSEVRAKLTLEEKRKLSQASMDKIIVLTKKVIHYIQVPLEKNYFLWKDACFDILVQLRSMLSSFNSTHVIREYPNTNYWIKAYGRKVDIAKLSIDDIAYAVVMEWIRHGASCENVPEVLAENRGKGKKGEELNFAITPIDSPTVLFTPDSLVLSNIFSKKSTEELTRFISGDEKVLSEKELQQFLSIMIRVMDNCRNIGRENLLAEETPWVEPPIVHVTACLIRDPIDAFDNALKLNRLINYHVKEIRDSWREMPLRIKKEASAFLNELTEQIGELMQKCLNEKNSTFQVVPLALPCNLWE